MATYKLTNTAIATKLWEANSTNSTTSTDKLTKVTVGKSAINTQYRLEPGTTNITSGGFGAGGIGWRTPIFSTDGYYPAGTWTFKAKLENNAKYTFAGKLSARIYLSAFASGALYQKAAVFGTRVWFVAQDSSYVYIADDTYVVGKYSKSSMDLEYSSPSYGSLVNSILVDDTYVYVAGNSNVISKYYKSDMSFVSSSPSFGSVINVMAMDDTYIYVGCENSSVKRCMISDMSVISSATNAVATNVRSMVIDDTYIYTADYSGILYKYLKSNMTFITSSTTSYGGMILAMTQDSTYLYIAGYGPYVVKKYQKSDLSFVCSSPSFDVNITSLVSDDKYVYAGGNSATAVRKFNKSDLSFVYDYPSCVNGCLALDENCIYMGGYDYIVRQYPINSFSPIVIDSSKILSLPGSAGSQVTDSWSSSLPQITIKSGNYLVAEYIFTITTSGSNAGAGFSFIVDEATGEDFTTTTFASIISVTGVSLDITSKSIDIGTVQQLIPTISPANATYQSVTWSSSNTNVASVDSNGLVTAVSLGSAIITVTTIDQSKTATCTIIVQDTIPPIVSNINTSNLTNNSVTINFNTNEITDSLIEYGTTTSLGLSVSSLTLETSHSINLSGLSQETIYYYKITSKDASNNTTVDDNSGNFYTFTTLFDGYKIERSTDNIIFSPLVSLPSTAIDYNDTNVIPGNTYYYRIKKIMYDNQGNWSNVVNITYTSSSSQVVISSVEITPNPCYVNNAVMISIAALEI